MTEKLTDPSGVILYYKNPRTNSFEPFTGAMSEMIPLGPGANGSVTLTVASTPYSIPAVAPNTPYVITVSNASDTDIYIGYANSAVGGVLLRAGGGSCTLTLGAGQTLYAWSAGTGKALSYTYKGV